jgi:hypothetical protein
VFESKGHPLADEASKERTQKLRAQQAEDGKKAMAEYIASAEVTRSKTEKLRALRLARDAAAPPVAAKPVAAKAAGKAKVAAKPATKAVKKPKAPAA